MVLTRWSLLSVHTPSPLSRTLQRCWALVGTRLGSSPTAPPARLRDMVYIRIYVPGLLWFMGLLPWLKRLKARLVK